MIKSKTSTFFGSAIVEEVVLARVPWYGQIGPARGRTVRIGDAQGWGEIGPWKFLEVRVLLLVAPRVPTTGRSPRRRARRMVDLMFRTKNGILFFSLEYGSFHRRDRLSMELVWRSRRSYSTFRDHEGGPESFDSVVPSVSSPQLLATGSTRKPGRRLSTHRTPLTEISPSL